MKKTTVSVAAATDPNTGATTMAKAAGYRIGPFAVHRRLDIIEHKRIEYRKHGWTVTHSATGRAIAYTRTREEAFEFADVLNSTYAPVRWTSVSASQLQDNAAMLADLHRNHFRNATLAHHES